MGYIAGVANYLNLCVFEGVVVSSPNGTTTPKFSMRTPRFSLVPFKFVCVSFLFTLFNLVDGTIVRKKTVRVGNKVG